MDKFYVLALMLATSAIYYLLARRSLPLQRGDVKQAVYRALEFIGCWVLVYLGNALFGLVLIFFIRRLTGFFISVYILNGLMFALFTAFQALVLYHLWLAKR